ncbi:MAG TPA: M1 family aminopeptidase [Thermoanaerobaculia bacterium]|nr:M1 family aminopeptidase [Thermoanaerobaculia bacterium]
MFKAITGFELKYHLKSPLFYILLVVYFLLTFLVITTDAVTIGGAIGAVNRNAPYVIMQLLLGMSVFGILTTTAFVANAIHRDFELHTDELFFSSPVKKAQYLGGRFTGSLLVAVLVYAGVALAIVIGSLMPWIDQERLGAFQLWPYVYSVLVLVLPNLLLCGAIFFAVTALTRSLMATYASVVAFFVAYGVASTKLSDIENELVAGLLDPFGFNAFSLATRYWTVFDKNTKLLPVEGVFLWNRLLWSAVAIAILAFAYWKFSFSTGTRKARKKARMAGVLRAEPMERVQLALPVVSQTFGGGASWRQFSAATRREAMAVFKSIPFIIMLGLGVANIWGSSTEFGALFGTEVYPTTAAMLSVVDGAFGLFALLIAAFYAGDIVWRERTLKMHDVHDAMPTPTWVIWASKAAALVLVILTSLAVAAATSMAIQLTRGYTNFEPLLYVQALFVRQGTWFILLAGLAFVLQVYFTNKFIGFLGILLWFILNPVLMALNFEHRLYRYASAPGLQYSDMNGFGHNVRPIVVFYGYWLLALAVGLVIAHLLWLRGTETGWKQRMSIARQRFGKPVAALLVLFVAGFITTGCYIYYNTNVLNKYRTTKEREHQQAEFEKRYKKYEGLPQPRVIDVQANVDIHPERRAVDVRGRYVVQNRTQAPISKLHVVLDSNLDVAEVTIPGGKLEHNDREHGYSIYSLATPLAPGAQLPVTFHTSWAARGFVNSNANVSVVENGTFINNSDFFPMFGYQEGFELQDRNKRRKNGLQPIERMKPPTDLKARMNNQISRDSDWINLDTTVSTSADQIALAPGYLQRSWSQNGRRYFHYKTTSPILGFWSYLSARYEVKRDKWNDIPIEVYYDKKHEYNVDRMIHGVKKSLDYFTKNFSPYQHKQVRILEFPGYRTFAQAFPNTIPYSESIGFVADLRDKEKIDYVFYITAHEIAHQWWAHQVIGGNVQGSTMLVETMAQYSSLMVMEKEYGRDQMQKFLRYELDLYLRSRGSELVAEKPLVLVENQDYIHYRKGSLVMYALRDAIGEEAVNRALAKFIRDYGFSGPPYTTATELVRYFRAEAGPEHQELITDLFERIVLFDNQARTATSTKRADGKYVVKVTVASSKLRGDDKGEEKPIPVNDMIDIGVFGDKEKVLFSEKRRITRPLETFEIVVSEKPVKAGIDPFNKLIDRNPKDNVKSL